MVVAATRLQLTILVTQRGSLEPIWQMKSILILRKMEISHCT